MEEEVTKQGLGAAATDVARVLLQEIVHAKTWEDVVLAATALKAMRNKQRSMVAVVWSTTARVEDTPENLDEALHWWADNPNPGTSVEPWVKRVLGEEGCIRPGPSHDEEIWVLTAQGKNEFRRVNGREPK
jgi:hypothetical protein